MKKKNIKMTKTYAYIYLNKFTTICELYLLYLQYYNSRY